MLKWIKKVQKLGRIQIPTIYLKSYNIEQGDEVIISQTEEDMTLSITFERSTKK